MRKKIVSSSFRSFNTYYRFVFHSKRMTKSLNKIMNWNDYVWKIFVIVIPAHKILLKITSEYLYENLFFVEHITT